MAARARLALSLLVCLSAVALAAGPNTPAPTAGAPSWQQLSPAQKQTLKPLEREWNSLDDTRRRKWITIADRYPAMTPQEQKRLQERMGEWVELSPTDRQKARAQYNRLRTAPPEERRALEQKWRDYDALPGEEKQRLKSAPKPVTPVASTPMPKPAVVAPPRKTAPPPAKPTTAARKENAQ